MQLSVASTAIQQTISNTIPLRDYLPKHFFYKALLISYAYLETRGTLTLISGPSMYPTLNSDQRSKVPDLIWSKSNFKHNELQVGDIVILASPLRKDYNFCKRIASLDDTFVYTSESPVPVYVPPGHFWALGDNPNNSHDSDQFGPVSQSLIKGVVTHRVYPWSSEAVARKVMSRSVNYQDPLLLLQQEFDKYKSNQQKKEESILTTSVKYINNFIFGSGSSESSSHNTASTMNNENIQAPTNTPNVNINNTSENFLTLDTPTTPDPNALTPEDIAFNRYQRQEAERHLQLLLTENKQDTKIKQTHSHNQQREQFLRDAGKWRDSDDTENGDNNPQKMIRNSPNSLPLPNTTQNNQQQGGGIDPSKLYNPFEARYGPVK